MTEPKQGTYRAAQPNETLPADHVQIPMYITTDQQEAFYRRLVAERAKDVTPKD